MIIKGADFHPEFQHWWIQTPRVPGKAIRSSGKKQFYRALAGQDVRVRMDASGHARWFERLVAELRFELWIGDPDDRVRKQKTDRQDAQLIMRLLVIASS